MPFGWFAEQGGHYVLVIPVPGPGSGLSTQDAGPMAAAQEYMRSGAVRPEYCPSRNSQSSFMPLIDQFPIQSASLSGRWNPSIRPETSHHDSHVPDDVVQDFSASLSPRHQNQELRNRPGVLQHRAISTLQRAATSPHFGHTDIWTPTTPAKTETSKRAGPEMAPTALFLDSSFQLSESSYIPPAALPHPPILFPPPHQSLMQQHPNMAEENLIYETGGSCFLEENPHYPSGHNELLGGMKVGDHHHFLGLEDDTWMHATHGGGSRGDSYLLDQEELLSEFGEWGEAHLDDPTSGDTGGVSMTATMGGVTDDFGRSNLSEWLGASLGSQSQCAKVETESDSGVFTRCNAPISTQPPGAETGGGGGGGLAAEIRALKAARFSGLDPPATMRLPVQNDTLRAWSQVQIRGACNAPQVPLTTTLPRQDEWGVVGKTATLKRVTSAPKRKRLGGLPRSKSVGAVKADPMAQPAVRGEQEGVAVIKEPAVSARVRREQLKGKVDILREFVDESLEAKDVVTLIDNFIRFYHAQHAELRSLIFGDSKAEDQAPDALKIEEELSLGDHFGRSGSSGGGGGWGGGGGSPLAVNRSQSWSGPVGEVCQAISEQVPTGVEEQRQRRYERRLKRLEQRMAQRWRRQKEEKEAEGAAGGSVGEEVGVDGGAVYMGIGGGQGMEGNMEGDYLDMIIGGGGSEGNVKDEEGHGGAGTTKAVRRLSEFGLVLKTAPRRSVMQKIVAELQAY